MMRLIKTLFLVIIGAGLVVVGIGNMAPVDVYLLPEMLTGQEFALTGVPLSAVIIAAVLLGLLIGQLMEWLREAKHRRRSSSRGREVAKLQNELTKLKRAHASPDDDLPKLPAR
ncbi:MAG: LapA family protein [Pseudomonadota bacterium]